MTPRTRRRPPQSGAPLAVERTAQSEPPQLAADEPVPPVDASAPTDAPTWRVLAAASAGAAHLRFDLPCQDAVAWRIAGDGALLCAASDGAGSAPRSAEGARLAVHAALDYLLARLPAAAGNSPAEIPTPGERAQPESPLAAPTPPKARRRLRKRSDNDDPNLEFRTVNPALPTSRAELLLAAFAAARRALEQLAEQEGLPLRDFAATLTLAIAGANSLDAGAVGDCALVAGASEDDLQTVIPLERGEYANETHFLSADDALERVRIVSRHAPAERLALFSDGLARLALQWPEQKPHRPFFAPLFAFAAGLPPAPLGAAAISPGDEPPHPGENTSAGGDTAEGGDASSHAAVLAGAAAQLAAFLASARVNSRTDDDKALILAVSNQASAVS